MRCLVCGLEYEGTGKCPVCGYQSFAINGELPAAIKAKIDEEIEAYKTSCLQSVKVSLVGYRWEEKNGELVEKAREEFLIGDQLEKVQIDEVVWGTTEFAKQTAGEEKEISIVVSDGNKNKNYNVKVVAPDTDSLWKVGVVLKPGFQIAIRVGNENKYSDSKLISLKGE